MQPLGKSLVDAGIISKEQLDEALLLQKQTGEKLGHILVNLGHLTEELLLSFLAKQQGLNFIYISEYEVSPDAMKLIPHSLIKKYNVFPLEFDKKSKTLTVAIPDPFDLNVIDDLKIATGFNINPVIASPKEINENSLKVFEKDDKGAMEELMESIGDKTSIELEVAPQAENAIQLAQEKPIVKLANNIITNAIRKRASDIHLEPFEKKCRLRYRIDGVTHEDAAFTHGIYNSLIARIKIMSKLDITETRKPQDGRIKMLIEGREIDFRVSVLPVIYGEKTVMRVLDSSALNLDMTKLGFEENTMQMFNRAINYPFGLILVTGPTGSGKSTTLYSALATLNRPEINIMTIEDPVEYLLQGITQVNVNPELDLTFATGLRAFLRQNPDIVLVGEIRDSETATTAIQASLTGHLVFSTLHTNDAPTAVTRLHNMGISAFLISSTLTLVVAQRLVRKICQFCKEAYEVPIEKLYHMGVTDEMVHGVKSVVLHKGKGCEKCSNGYKGRMAIYEVMEVNDAIRELILKGGSDIDVRKAANANGMVDLRKAAIKKLLLGITSIEEVMKTTGIEASE